LDSNFIRSSVSSVLAVLLLLSWLIYAQSVLFLSFLLLSQFPRHAKLGLNDC
jgi:hypothetical protein